MTFDYIESVVVGLSPICIYTDVGFRPLRVYFFSYEFFFLPLTVYNDSLSTESHRQIFIITCFFLDRFHLLLFSNEISFTRAFLHSYKLLSKRCLVFRTIY